MLSISQLGFRYPHADGDALQDVSLSLARGRVLGLLGPNGAGKTTLVGHLAGLLTVQRGEIRIDGEPLAAARASRPTRIAIAPQDYAFYPMLTVSENLDCFAAAARLAGARRRERVQACIAFARLERFTRTRAERLSGGLKRRLNLAIAVLAEPELLLFDEPTVGVDPQSRAFILEAIRAIARSGAAVIYASHYMEEIEAIADEVVILDHGRVLRAGTLDDLLATDTATLALAATGLAPEDLAARLAPFGEAHVQGGEVIVRLGASPAAVLAALEAQGVPVCRARFGRADLEQLFMSLTQRSLRDT